MFIAISYDDHGCINEGTDSFEDNVFMAETFEDITAQLEQYYNNVYEDCACPRYTIYELGQSWTVSAEYALTMTVDKTTPSKTF